MISNYIRQIARDGKYQMLFARAKDLGNIRFFANDRDFTRLQIEFLYWLEVYNSVYQDLYLKTEYLTDDVIKDEIRFDAYLLYRQRKDEIKKNQKTSPKYNRDKLNLMGIPSIVFTSK